MSHGCQFLFDSSSSSRSRYLQDVKASIEPVNWNVVGDALQGIGSLVGAIGTVISYISTVYTKAAGAILQIGGAATYSIGYGISAASSSGR